MKKKIYGIYENIHKLQKNKDGRKLLKIAKEA